jgi:membrane-associated phospholipid phosphatase
VTAIAIAAGFFLAYFFVGARPHTSLAGLHTRMDDAIPFIPSTVVVYLSAFLAVFQPVVFVRPIELFRRTAIAYALAIALSITVFLAIPMSADSLRINATSLDTSRLFPWLVARLYALDPPTNLFPSLHVSLTLLAAVSVWMTSRRAGMVAACWALCIALSACTVKQHFVVDVVGGAAVTVLVAPLLMYEAVRAHVRQ